MSKVKRVIKDQTQSAEVAKRWLYLQFTLALLLVLGGIGMLLWMALSSNQSQASGTPPPLLEPGQPAPDFSLPALSGETVQLSKLAGQVVVVNLWATWCPPCKAEMPAINAYYEAHRQEGLTVLAVNHQEDAATVKNFIQAQGFSFPVLLDQEAQVSNRYEVRGFPTTFIIDRKGRIQYIQRGEISAQQLATVIGPLLQ